MGRNRGTILMKTAGRCIVIVTALAFTFAAGAASTKRAQEELKAQRYWQAFVLLLPNLSGKQREQEAAKRLLAKYPDSLPGMVTQGVEVIRGVQTIEGAETLSDYIERGRSSSVLTEASYDTLLTELRNTVESALRSGRMKADITHVDSVFPEVMSGPAALPVIEETLSRIRALPTTNGERRAIVVRLFESLRNTAVPLEARNSVQAALPTLPLSPAELKEDVVPALGAGATKSLARSVWLDTGPNRILAIELRDVLAANPRVALTGDIASAEYVVAVEEEFYRENGPTDRVQTLTLGDMQIDVAYRALFMPRGASYLIDVRQQTIDARYAYLVSVRSPAEDPREAVLRDVVEVTRSQCENPRVVNVLGGTSTPYGWPNTQIAAMCTAAQPALDTSVLRKNVLQRVAEKIDEQMRLSVAQLQH